MTFGHISDVVETGMRLCVRLLAALSILIFFHHGRNPVRAPWRLALGALAAGIAYLGSGLPGPFEKSDGLCCGRGDVALQIALADAYCGKKNSIWPVDGFFVDLDSASAARPISDYIFEKLDAPDLASACKTLAPYTTFHEYSSSALLKFALWLPPADTPLSLMTKARWFVLLLGLAAGAMFAFCRLGLFPIYLSSEAAYAIAGLLEPGWWTDYYYYLPALLLFSIPLCAVFGLALARAKPLALFTCAVLAGLALAIIANFRTTYGLALTGGLTVSASAALIVHGVRRTRSAELALRAAAIVALIATAAAANVLLYQSFRVADSASKIEHHLVWHPVVLGLANPGTAFTRSEGIAWDDFVGEPLAHKVDPGANYMTPGYEAALKTYYLSLWRDHPEEMLRAYWVKLDAFGRDYARVLRQFGYSETFAAIGLGGVPLMTLMALLFAGMIFACGRARCLELAFLAVSVTAFIFIMGLEYVLILPTFYYTTNGASLSVYILFEWCIVAALVCWLAARRGPTSQASANSATAAAPRPIMLAFATPLVLFALFSIGEAAARIAAGYSLKSAPLVRIDDPRIEDKDLALVPRPHRAGLYGTPPPERPRAGSSRGVRSIADPRAIRIVVASSDFGFGDDGDGLSKALQTELGRRAGADPRLKGKTFAVLDVPRDVIGAEAANLEPALVIIDGAAQSRPLSDYVVLRKLKVYNPAFGRELEWQAGAEIFRRPYWSALIDAVMFPLREFPMKYYWRFAERSGERDASRLALLEDFLRVAREAGCHTLMLGPRQSVRPHQAFPRERRSFRLNWYRANGPLRTKHSYQVFEHDEALSDSVARSFGAGYLSFAPIAGKLRYFDDDLTLSRGGYQWTAAALADRIVQMTAKGELRPAVAANGANAGSKANCGGTRDASASLE